MAKNSAAKLVILVSGAASLRDGKVLDNSGAKRILGIYDNIANIANTAEVGAAFPFIVYGDMLE